MTQAIPRASFARWCLRLAGDAGWRVVLHVLPYALAAGVFWEAAARLRVGRGWTLLLAAAGVVGLHVAVVLGAHVAALRIARFSGESGARQPFRRTLSVAGEGLTILAITALAGLAMVGALDVALVSGLPLTLAPMLLRMISTASGLAVMGVMLAAGTAAAALARGYDSGFSRAASGLVQRSTRTGAVIIAAIVLATAAVVLANMGLRWLDLTPAIIPAILGKAAGCLMAVTVLSVGAAALVAAEQG